MSFIVTQPWLIAMLMNSSVELFYRACFNYTTLGDLYKHSAYNAILQKHNLDQS